MNNVNTMRLVRDLWLLIGGACALFYLTGCATLSPGGFELGGTVGLYSIDQREQTTTARTQSKPMVCWFRDCSAMEGK